MVLINKTIDIAKYTQLCTSKCYEIISEDTMKKIKIFIAVISMIFIVFAAGCGGGDDSKDKGSSAAGSAGSSMMPEFTVHTLDGKEILLDKKIQQVRIRPI